MARMTSLGAGTDYNMMDDAPLRNRLLDADENRGLAPVFVSNSKKVVIQEGTRIKHLTNEEIRKIQDGDYEKPKATYQPQEVNHRVFGKEKANFSPSHKVDKVPIFFGSERLRVIDVHGKTFELANKLEDQLGSYGVYYYNKDTQTWECSISNASGNEEMSCIVNLFNWEDDKEGLNHAIAFRRVNGCAMTFLDFATNIYIDFTGKIPVADESADLLASIPAEMLKYLC